MPTKTKAKAKTRKEDRYRRVSDRLLELMSKGVLPWEKPWKSSSRPFSNLVSGHCYRGSNILLAQIDVMLNDWELPYFVGFSQAQSLGWKIRKGSKATNLIYAGRYKVASEDDDKKETYIPFCKFKNVFSVHCFDDSEGTKKIADFLPSHSESGQNPDSKLPSLEEFCSRQSVEVSHSGDCACYSPELDRINMPRFEDFSSAYYYYTVLLHEHAHSTGHKDRLNRPLTGRFGSPGYAFEELVAELTACFVSTELQLDTERHLEHHASYLSSWKSRIKEDDRYFFKAMSAARMAADYLLTEGGISTSDD